MSLDDQLRRAFDDLNGQLRDRIAQAVQSASAEVVASAAAERTTALEMAEADATRRLRLAVESAESHAREIGYTEGREVGRREGREIGVAEGTAQGLATGRDEGRAAGFDAGRQHGWDEGWRRGYADGQKAGYEEGQQVGRGDQRAKEQLAAKTLADALRTLDRAPSLSAILDVLVNACCLEAARVSVLLAVGDGFRAWQFSGFGAPFDHSTEMDIALADAGLLVDVVRTQASVARRSGARPPVFAGEGPHSDAFATPIVLGGQVVAVVYADQGAAPASDDASDPAWWARVEVIARHAARCLETVTALRTAQLLTRESDGRGASPSVTRAAS
jgi:hypothetical protein